MVLMGQQRRGGGMTTAAVNSGDGELAGKVALVTGAAGGIGSATTAALLAAGAMVVAEDIDPLTAPEGYSGRFAVLQGDAADAATARAAVDAAVTGFGRLDILVNLAGRFLGKSILDTTDEDFDALMTTNVRSVFVHCREALPALLERGDGAIVSAGSISGIIGLPQQAAYCTTKAAVTLLTRQIAAEYSGRGVRANVVAPGAVETTFVSRSRAADGAPPPTPEQAAAALASVQARHPIGRMGTPREIADVIVFLASPRASFVTGAIVSADGGYTAI
jgi:NAD(P)-dependent dehydrogenase (short-subunit alcohol dehydrogenase family)